MYHDINLHRTANLNNDLTARFRRLLQTQSRNSKWLACVSPLALAACGGGVDDTNILDDEIDDENPSLDDEQVSLGSSPILQKLEFDISNVDLKSLPWLTPASGGFFGEAVKVSGEDIDYVVIPAMFDVDHGTNVTDQIEGHLFVFESDGTSFSQANDVIVTGFTFHPYLIDLDGDGVDEIIGVPNGEDGRVILEDSDVFTKPFSYNLVTGTVEYFGNAAWQHSFGFADVNYDGTDDLIIAPIGDNPVSVVYNLMDFSEIEIDHAFTGHNEGEIAFGDIDGDGLVEFFETNSTWMASTDDGNLYFKIYEIDTNGSVSLQQTQKFGELDGGRYEHKAWNGNEADLYHTGTAFGYEFNLIHQWHSEFIDIDNDDDDDLVMIFSINNNEQENRLDALDAGTSFEGPIKIVTVKNVDGVFSYDTLDVIDVDADFVGKGWTFEDLNRDGYVDMYLDINLMVPDFSGSDLIDRIWINDGTGSFISITDVNEVPLFDDSFLSAGEFTVLEINDTLTLVGISSNLDGTDLSFVSLPISELIA